MRRAYPRLESLEPMTLPSVAYNVGPTEMYQTVHDLPWPMIDAESRSGVKVTVLVDWKPTPYLDKVDLTMAASANAPFTFQGVPNPANPNQYPVFEAAGAIENHEPLWDYGPSAEAVFTVTRRFDDPGTYQPSNIVLSNLEIQDATKTVQFENLYNVWLNYNDAAAGIAIYGGDHIKITHVYVHDSANGLFTKSDDVDTSPSYYTTNLVVTYSRFAYDGIGDGHHCVYDESINATFKGDYIGPEAASSGGMNFAAKFRDAGLNFAYNTIEGGAVSLDVVDPENDYYAALASPYWGQNYVYGNQITQDDGAYVVWFGGDTGNVSIYQPTLWFYGNTVVANSSYYTGGQWVFKSSTNAQTAYVVNNVFEYPLSYPFSLADEYGDYELGVNWGRTGMQQWAATGQGTINGWNNLLFGSDPGFVNESGMDYHLTASSPLIGYAFHYDSHPSYWPGNAPLPVYQPDGAARTVWDDIGAYEYGGVVNPSGPTKWPLLSDGLALAAFETAARKDTGLLLGLDERGSWEDS